MRQFLAALGMPLFGELLNQVVCRILNVQLGPMQVVDILSSLSTGAIIVWAGWIVSMRFRSIGKGAIAGVAVWFLSAVVIGGGWILLESIFLAPATIAESVTTLAGLIVAFLLFSPVSVLLGLVGGFVAKRWASMGSP